MQGAPEERDATTAPDGPSAERAMDGKAVGRVRLYASKRSEEQERSAYASASSDTACPLRVRS